MVTQNYAKTRDCTSRFCEVEVYSFRDRYLSESDVPSHCLYGAESFLTILKHNNMIASTSNFELNNNPVSDNDWDRIGNDSEFLGDWEIVGGDEELELWNDFDLISDRRDNVAELDGD